MTNQLTLFPTSERSERDQSVPSAPAVPAMWTAPYRAVRGGAYFRFYWQDGKQTRHLHIRGGNSFSSVATANRAAVDAAIGNGASVAEIKQLICSHQRKLGNYKRSVDED